MQKRDEQQCADSRQGLDFIHSTLMDLLSIPKLEHVVFQKINNFSIQLFMKLMTVFLVVTLELGELPQLLHNDSIGQGYFKKLKPMFMVVLHVTEPRVPIKY